MKKGTPAVIGVCIFLLIISSFTLTGSSFVPGASFGVAYTGPLTGAAQEELENGGSREKYIEKWSDTDTDGWYMQYLYYCADRSGLVGEEELFGEYTNDPKELLSRLADQDVLIFPLGDNIPCSGDVVFWYATSGGSSVDVLPPYPEICHAGIVTEYGDAGLTVVEPEGDQLREHTYTELYGQTRSGAAIWGFARITYPDAQALVDMIKGFEGFCKYPIWDYAQWSVGYGTRCPDDKLEEYQKNGIPEDEAEALLQGYIIQFEASVDGYISRNNLELTPAQRNALVSLSYNIGIGWMTSSAYASLRQVIADPQSPDELVQVFSRICHAGGEILPALVGRRICEAWLFLTGIYTNNYQETGYRYEIIADEVKTYRTEMEDMQ